MTNRKTGRKNRIIEIPLGQLSEIYDYVHEVSGRPTEEQARLKQYIMSAICDTIAREHKKDE